MHQQAHTRARKLIRARLPRAFVWRTGERAYASLAIPARLSAPQHLTGWNLVSVRLTRGHVIIREAGGFRAGMREKTRRGN